MPDRGLLSHSRLTRHATSAGFFRSFSSDFIQSTKALRGTRSVSTWRRKEMITDDLVRFCIDDPDYVPVVSWRRVGDLTIDPFVDAGARATNPLTVKPIDCWRNLTIFSS